MVVRGGAATIRPIELVSGSSRQAASGAAAAAGRAWPVTPYWRDDAATLYVGDAYEVLATLPDRAVDCVVTSPPYWGQRDYGVPGQYGMEPTPDAYVQRLRAVFAEVRRVLADDGTVWLNLGDGYAANSDGCRRGAGYRERQPLIRPPARLALAPKNLVGMPWRVAFVLQDDGWILRNAIVWHKPNAMPESVTDRLSCRYEFVFLLVKQRHYWFDLDAIREPHRRGKDAWPPVGGRQAGQGCVGGSARRRRGSQPNVTGAKYAAGMPHLRRRPGTNMLPTGRRHTAAHADGGNPGDVWPIPTRPYRQAHFAVFPLDVPLRCIAAGCRPGGKVLDPFCGAGTTALAARQLGRSFLGVDICQAYCDLAIARLRAASAGGGRR
ncbi:MAG: site-specific DNA-methyltransferase [Streptosporangiales bacterium]|nr:site-specific DNA-methyltransferase [Streptosporangiales bacterium]